MNIVKISQFPNIPIPYFIIQTRLYFDVQSFLKLLNQSGAVSYATSIFSEKLFILKDSEVFPVIDAQPLKNHIKSIEESNRQTEGLMQCILSLIDCLEANLVAKKQISVSTKPVESTMSPVVNHESELQVNQQPVDKPAAIEDKQTKNSEPLYSLSESYKILLFDGLNMLSKEYYQCLRDLQFIYKTKPSSDWVATMNGIRKGFVAPLHISVPTKFNGVEAKIDKESCKITALGIEFLKKHFSQTFQRAF